MPILPNLEEIRQYVETDLGDDVLETYALDADRAIVSRYGPNFEDITAPLTRVLVGGYTVLLGIPTGATVSAIRESSLLVLNTHYQVKGDLYERLPLGTRWAARVEVDYTPLNTTYERKRIAVQLVKLAVEYTALESERVGDYSATQRDYASERTQILASLGSGLPVIA